MFINVYIYIYVFTYDVCNVIIEGEENKKNNDDDKQWLRFERSISITMYAWTTARLLWLTIQMFSIINFVMERECIHKCTQKVINDDIRQMDYNDLLYLIVITLQSHKIILQNNDHLY